jgi:hypothetical protein
MWAATKRMAARAAAPGGAVIGGALALRVIYGVGFANYDTLYALAWGGQLSRGVAPAYEVPIASTPHPLLELLGLVLAPLSAHAIVVVTVALGFLALAACGWAIYRLAADWFGAAAGVLAALVFLTRLPVLSYGVRAYVDLPYVLFVLCALLVEARHRRARHAPAGAPVLALLALAGLLRPEAWAFSALYWLYLMGFARFLPAWAGGSGSTVARSRVKREVASSSEWFGAGRERRELVRLTLLAAAAPLVWLGSDLLVTGDPLWSLTHTRDDASTLGRVTGIANVPEYIPRRLGEILRPPVLAAAALGGVLSLLWLRSRALPGALAGALAVVVFACFAAVGLPIDTRYAFLAAAILCVFAGAGVCGWTLLPRGDARRRWWMAGSALVLVALVAYAPSQYRAVHNEMDTLARQHAIEGELVALVSSGAINLRCGPVGVPNHAPVPLLALYLKTSPANVVSLQSGHIHDGVYVDPATKEVEEDYVLAARDPVEPVSVPPGFSEAATDRSWLVFERCA